MESSTGRWVSGENFFDREAELETLKRRVQEGNHVLLTGQRRMGKTSLIRELGHRLEADGWIFLFVDVEGAACAEDAIADIGQAAYPFCSASSSLFASIGRWFDERVEEVGAFDFRIKFRAGLNAGNWRRHGEELVSGCTAGGMQALLVIDELPIFLQRMLSDEDGERRVDEFLGWLRGLTQKLGSRSPVFVVSGSIGLGPMVSRLGISDRINHLYPVRLGPWNRETSISCFDRLAESYRLPVEPGVACAVYEKLGIGIPHHIQSFFARLHDYSVMRGRNRITVADVEEVYRTELLGPPGQSDLQHYETRLRSALDEVGYAIAMEILAEAAVHGEFAPGSRRCLERLYAPVTDDTQGQIARALEVLEHDGYLEADRGAYRFPSRLLKDWWSARFRDHHVPLEKRASGN